MITVYRVSETPVSMTTLTWAVRVLFLHATAVTILAILTTYIAATSNNMSTISAVATPLITFFFAAVFGGLGYALHQLRAWARGPAIVMELLLIPIGFGAISGIALIGLVVAITGLVGAGLLLAPSTRTALGLSNGPSA
jgi:hypothetical protein